MYLDARSTSLISKGTRIFPSCTTNPKTSLVKVIDILLLDLELP